MISASPTRSSRLRVSAVLVAAASALAVVALPAADASARDFTYRPARGAVLPVARGPAAVAAAQPLAPRALGVGPRRPRQLRDVPARRLSGGARQLHAAPLAGDLPRHVVVQHGLQRAEHGRGRRHDRLLAPPAGPAYRVLGRPDAGRRAQLQRPQLHALRQLDVEGVQGHRAPAQGLKSRRAWPGVEAAVGPPRSRPLPARASGAARRLRPHRGKESGRRAARLRSLSRGGVLGNGRPATSGQDSSARLARGARRGVPARFARRSRHLAPGAGSNVGLAPSGGGRTDVRRPGPREVVRNTRDRTRKTRAPEDDDPPRGPPPPPVPVERATLARARPTRGVPRCAALAARSPACRARGCRWGPARP